MPTRIQRTMAISLAALILFIPANTLPILRVTAMGHETSDTIWQGVVSLWDGGTRSVAVLVLLCSIVIPLGKLIGLFYLCGTWRTKAGGRLLRTIEIIGRWSMLDVFLVSILVALVKLGDIARVTPGPGLLAFAAVVVLTMIASATLDLDALRAGKEPSRAG